MVRHLLFLFVCSCLISVGACSGGSVLYDYVEDKTIALNITGDPVQLARGSSHTLLPTGGYGIYTFSSDQPQNVRVDSAGVVTATAVTDSDATVTVTDMA